MKNDTISRQDALDAIRPLQTYKLFEGDDMILVDKAEVQTELMMLPSTEPEQETGEWISTSERMPEESGDYLVWMPYAPLEHRIAIATYYSDYGGYWGIKTPISAWMSLPEPYTERRTDEQEKGEQGWPEKSGKRNMPTSVTNAQGMAMTTIMMKKLEKMSKPVMVARGTKIGRTDDGRN